MKEVKSKSARIPSLEEFKSYIKSKSKFEIEFIASKIKPYLDENKDELNSVDGYNLAMIYLNLYHYVKAIKSIDKGEDSESGIINFINSFELLLVGYLKILKVIKRQYIEELKDIKDNSPELYEEYKKIIKNK